MKNLVRIFALLSLVSLSLCTTNTNQDAQNTASGIEAKIEILKSENTLDETKVNDLITHIDAFVSENKDAAKTPVYLELKAKYLTALGKNKASLAVYKKIYEQYPKYENHSDALFMMAFINENNLNDKAQAEMSYQKYLNEFPEGDFAKDAQFSLDNMNKTPEELMEMFKKMNEEINNQD